MLHVPLGALVRQPETDFPPVTVIILAVTLAFGKSLPRPRGRPRDTEQRGHDPRPAGTLHRWQTCKYRRAGSSEQRTRKLNPRDTECGCKDWTEQDCRSRRSTVAHWGFLLVVLTFVTAINYFYYIWDSHRAIRRIESGKATSKRVRRENAIMPCTLCNQLSLFMILLAVPSFPCTRSTSEFSSSSILFCSSISV